MPSQDLNRDTVIIINPNRARDGRARPARFSDVLRAAKTSTVNSGKAGTATARRIALIYPLVFPITSTGRKRRLRKTFVDYLG
jgi:hypothetical protein